MRLEYSEQLGDHPIEIVVHHLIVTELLESSDLLGAGGHPALHRLLIVTTPAQARTLGLHARGDQEHDDGVGALRPDLLSALAVDLEQEIAAWRSIGHRRPVLLAEELRVLQEFPGSHRSVELLPVHEHVRVGPLAWARRPRGPRAAEPQTGIGGDQCGSHRPLAGAARTRQDDDQGFAVWVSKASRWFDPRP